jgi:hypothetical protein
MCPECFHVVAQSLRHFSMAAGLRLAMARIALDESVSAFLYSAATQRPPLSQHGRTSPLIGPSKNPQAGSAVLHRPRPFAKCFAAVFEFPSFWVYGERRTGATASRTMKVGAGVSFFMIVSTAAHLRRNST